MRRVIDPQMKLDEVDLYSRDEIPQLLMGLQEIYRNRERRAAVFKVLEETNGAERYLANGRPGIELWKILVLGTLRLACNWDCDKLRGIANNHFAVRQMLGHSMFDWNQRYALQTLIDNVSLFPPSFWTGSIRSWFLIATARSGQRLIGSSTPVSTLLRWRPTSTFQPTSTSFMTPSERHDPHEALRSY